MIPPECLNSTSSTKVSVEVSCRQLRLVQPKPLNDDSPVLGQVVMEQKGRGGEGALQGEIAERDLAAGRRENTVGIIRFLRYPFEDGHVAMRAAHRRPRGNCDCRVDREHPRRQFNVSPRRQRRLNIGAVQVTRRIDRHHGSCRPGGRHRNRHPRIQTGNVQPVSSRRGVGGDTQPRCVLRIGQVIRVAPGKCRQWNRIIQGVGIAPRRWTIAADDGQMPVPRPNIGRFTRKNRRAPNADAVHIDPSVDYKPIRSRKIFAARRFFHQIPENCATDSGASADEFAKVYSRFLIRLPGQLQTRKLRGLL